MLSAWERGTYTGVRCTQHAVGLAKGNVHSMLLDVKEQPCLLQDKVDFLIRCEEERRVVGVGLEERGFEMGFSVDELGLIRER